jgi:hypothetical protein
MVKLGLTGGSEGVAWSETSKSFLMGSSGSIHAYKLDGDGAAKPIAKAACRKFSASARTPRARAFWCA